jgi:CubicO group peptidase (beta-lactamase class C family)
MVITAAYMRLAAICSTLAAVLAGLPSVSRGKEAESIVSSLQPYIERHAFAGVVTLVASKDRVLSLEAVGYTDVTAQKPMPPNALFWIASMSKPVTVAALMMLVDEGKVRLEDPVEKYLPQFTPKLMEVAPDGKSVQLRKPRHQITVRDLLRHTSGLRPTSSIENPTLDRFTLEARVQSYAIEPLIYEPGTRFLYSNAGINTAARIVEVAVGTRFETFLQERLFNPLKMDDTTFWPTTAQLKRLAKSYAHDASGTQLQEIPITQLRYPLTDHINRYPMPAGGLFSTAKDMGTFCQMLLNSGQFGGKRYLSASAVELMARNQLSPQILQTLREEKLSGFPSEEADGYGLGFFTKTTGIFSHAGAYATNMRIDLQQGLATVWLIQYGGSSTEPDKGREVFEKAAERWFKPTVPAH